MIEKIREYLSLPKNRKYIGIIAIIAIVAAVPLTVLVALQQQDIRQRASEIPATPPFPPSETPPAGATVSLVFDPNSANLILDGQILSELQFNNVNDITGIDLTINFNKEILELASFRSNRAFESELINTIDNNLGTFHYAAVDTQRSQKRGTLGALFFRGKAVGTTQITFGNVQATALNYNGALGLDPSSTGGTYTVVAQLPTNTPIPTSTIVPPTNTPIPSPTVVPPTATSTPAPVAGDADGDGAITILDYNIWRDEFKGTLTTKRADFDKNGKVELADFGIWRNAFEAVNNTPGLTVNPSNVTNGERITISWNNIPTPRNENVIYMKGSNGGYAFYASNCSIVNLVTPTITPLNSGSCTIVLPNGLGTGQIQIGYFNQYSSISSPDGVNLTNYIAFSTFNTR